MNKKLFLPVFLFAIFSSSQEKIPFVDYDEISKKVRESADQGDYEKTLEHIGKINKNDSTYCSLLVSKSYYQMALKKYDEAINTIEEGLKTKCYDLHSSFYINKVVVLLREKRNKEALMACEAGLKRFPVNKTLWYNKGVILEAMGKIEEAVAMYEKTILLDPFYKKVYLQLGNLCYKQELISQALMCYNMFLLIEPDAKNAFDILKSLNSTVQSKNKNSKNTDIKISLDDWAFEEIDLILYNKIALNENYDTGNEIDIALTRQNHALLASLKNFSGNGGFWDKKFVPYYKWVQNEGLFNAFTYTLSYSIENETHKKSVEKNMDKIQEFFELSKQKWAEIIQSNAVIKDGKEENLTYYFDDGYIKGVGKREGDIIQGPWKFYNDKGRLTGEGSFNTAGNRDGEWTWYNTQGNIRETAVYENGILNGENNHYYDNGRKKITAYYTNDELDGEYRYFYEKGGLQQKKYFKNGKLDGIYQSYHAVGEQLIETEAMYVDGNIEEKYVEYFPTGNISSEIQFKDGKAHGQEIAYHLNETMKTDLVSKEGLASGYYKKFHSNGSLKEVGQTSNGEYVGAWRSFYSHGALESEFSYSEKGENDGEYKYYDTDGKLYYIFEYRKGELIAYKYFDKDGGVIDENRKKGGEFYYRGYSPEGVPVTEGLYDIKGGKKGRWKYYTENGVLTSDGVYEDNLAQGEHKSYYSTGELLSLSNYKNDSLVGYYVNYHKNGKIKRQGWYKENTIHGEWRSYTVDGTLVEINFYHKGTLHGEQLLFSNKGIKTMASHYEYGQVKKDIYYNRDGSIVQQIDHENDRTNYELVYYHANKKPSTKMTYVNGVKHGSYSFHGFYGNKQSAGQYLNGKLNGEFNWFYDDGSLETTANYLNGELHGGYTYYYEDGTIESTYHYSLGKLQKEAITYHENGSIETKSNYHDDERHGRRESFSPYGKLQLVRFYDYGRLIGYSYLDGNSKEVPMIPIEKETGKMVSYYDNGKIAMELAYKNGYLDGEFKEYYSTGQLRESIYYEHGEVQGKRVQYFADGILKKEGHFELGNRHGVFKEYFENGKLKKEEAFVYNTKEGPAKKYNSNGELIKEELYFDGNIISATTY